MDYTRRRALRRRIREFWNLGAVVQFLESQGEDPEKGVNLAGLEDEVVAVLYLLVVGHLPLPSAEDARARRAAYQRQARLLANDALWISRKIGEPSAALSQRLRRCGIMGHRIVNNFYVAPSTHYGTNVGSGLFALSDILRGQALCQFTGRLHALDDATSRRRSHPNKRRKTLPELSTAYLRLHKRRGDYCIAARYGLGHYIVNPLTEDDSAVDAAHFAAYINEPSPPPHAIGDIVRVGTRNGVVLGYVREEEVYVIEYAKGERDYVDPTQVKFHPLQTVAGANGPTPDASDKAVANALWYDFPVPLEGLYQPTGVRRGERYTFRRTAKTSVVLPWSIAELPNAFSAFSDTTAIFRWGKGVQPSVGMLLLLEEEVFHGLERYALVEAVETNRIHARHFVRSSVAWRLSPRVFAGKARRCAACEKEGQDDPKCHRCSFVPFPIVYACTDIRAEQEILVLYEKNDPDRGMQCSKLLDEDSMRPRWDDL